MKLFYAFLMMFSILITSSASASTFLTREETFSYLWQTIKRPILETNEKQFTDVAPTRASYNLLRFAKRRGVLEDETAFYPEDPIDTDTLQLWLLRTRNVASIEYLTRDALPTFVSKYASLQGIKSATIPKNIPELATIVSAFDSELAHEEHEISFYGEKWHGQGTAFGESFDMNAMTAAHPSFPYNTLIRVTNVANQKSVVVRVNDRGPFVPNRDLDLSLASFIEIADTSKGVAKATIERLGDKDMYETSVASNGSSINLQTNSSAAEASSITTNILPPVTEEKLHFNSISVPSTCSNAVNSYQKRVTKTVHLTRGIPHELPLGQSVIITANDFLYLKTITLPNASVSKVNTWISPKKEQFMYAPDTTGMYSFYISTGKGRGRMFTTNVVQCSRLLTIPVQ